MPMKNSVCRVGARNPILPPSAVDSAVADEVSDVESAAVEDEEVVLPQAASERAIVSASVVAIAFS